jgi:hypothetical protein
VPGLTVDETFAAHFAWLREISFHDLGVRVLGAITFLALVGLGRSLAAGDPARWADLHVERSTIAASGRFLMVAGMFGALGQLVEFGGHQAAIAASGSFAPAGTVSLIQFFVDQVGAAITTAAWAVFAVAAFAGAVAMRGRMAIPGVVLGAVLLVMAGSRLFDDPADIADALLFVVGVALIPLWALSLGSAGIERRMRIGQFAA